jgi:O-antigen/teichoic acid export membrane protein
MFFRPGMSAASDLIVGCSVASLMGVVFWFVQYRKLSFSGFPIDFRLLGTGWRYVKQGRWLFLAGVTCYTYVGLELPLLGWLRSTEELGQYRTAVTLVGAGAGLLAIVPTLLFPRFVEWRKQGEEFLWHRQRQLARAAGAVVVLGTVLSLLVVPVLHPIVFGSAFASAAWPCAILVVSKLIVLVNGIYAWGLWSDARCDKLMASCMGLAATFSLTLNLALIPRFGMHAAAWVNVGSELLILVACYLMARRRVRMLAVQGEA